MEHSACYEWIKIILHSSCNPFVLQIACNSLKNDLFSTSENHLVTKLSMADNEHLRTSKPLRYLFSIIMWLERNEKNQHKCIHISFQEVSVSFDFIFSLYATGISSSSDVISLFSITIITHLQALALSEKQNSMVPAIYK